MSTTNLFEQRSPPPEELVQRAKEYLGAHRCMSLATDGTEGLWAAPVFYVSEGFHLYFMSRSDTRHVRNIEAKPYVAATVSDDVAQWLSIRGIQLEGRVELVDGFRREEVLAAFQRRYAFAESLWWTNNPTAGPAEQRIYRIRPTRVLFVDHGVRDAGFEIPARWLDADPARDL